MPRVLRNGSKVVPSRAREQKISRMNIEKINEAMQTINIAPYYVVQKNLAEATLKTKQIAGCIGISR